MEDLIAALIAALIGALATIFSPIIYDRIKSKKPSTHISDITGVWQCKNEKITDRFRIEKQDGRYIKGSRTYTGTDGITRDYTFIGYFDGTTAAIAITSVSNSEARTLGILLHRLDSDTFTGCRFFDGRGQIRYFSNLQWHKQR